ncbi:hypothetical protein NEFER02_1357 [Nematocida sp. LUAm2]|nr:hypothetical protein NEFER02_1357 [Nematocida sp. LUAm2]
MLIPSATARKNCLNIEHVLQQLCKAQNELTSEYKPKSKYDEEASKNYLKDINLFIGRTQFTYELSQLNVSISDTREYIINHDGEYSLWIHIPSPNISARNLDTSSEKKFSRLLYNTSKIQAKNIIIKSHKKSGEVDLNLVILLITKIRRCNSIKFYGISNVKKSMHYIDTICKRRHLLIGELIKEVHVNVCGATLKNAVSMLVENIFNHNMSTIQRLSVNEKEVSKKNNSMYNVSNIEYSEQNKKDIDWDKFKPTGNSNDVSTDVLGTINKFIAVYNKDNGLYELGKNNISIADNKYIIDATKYNGSSGIEELTMYIQLFSPTGENEEDKKNEEALAQLVYWISEIKVDSICLLSLSSTPSKPIDFYTLTAIMSKLKNCNKIILENIVNMECNPKYKPALNIVDKTTIVNNDLYIEVTESVSLESIEIFTKRIFIPCREKILSVKVSALTLEDREKIYAIFDLYKLKRGEIIANETNCICYPKTAGTSST